MIVVLQSIAIILQSIAIIALGVGLFALWKVVDDLNKRGEK